MEVVRRLRAAGIDFWIEGGWGVDALLGEQTRPHDDLDLGVRANDVDRIGATFPDYERDDAEWPSSFVLRGPKASKIDCHPLRFDARGDGWQANASGGAPYRWPREGMTGHGRIGGVAVPCITPELQLRWHAYPEFDDIDWRDVTLLAERFALPLPAELQSRPGFVAKKRARPELP